MFTKYKLFGSLILAVSSLAIVYSHSFEVDDSVRYRITWKSYSQMLEFLRTSESSIKTMNSVVYITGVDKRSYVCEVPNPKKEEKKKTSNYFGPSPAQLIEPLYKGRICFYWVDVYWTYKLCHGRYIVQYHEKKDRKTRTEYYLGSYSPEQAKLKDIVKLKEEEYSNQGLPPTRRIDDQDLAYFAVTYKHGTICDLTGKPRTTVVVYACKDRKEGIYDITEVSTCNYEMIVLTERLCAHPAFRLDATSEFEINCYSRDPNNGTVKPFSLVKMEEEAAAALDREYGLVHSQTVDSGIPLKTENNEVKSSDFEKKKSLVPESSQNKEESGKDKPVKATENVAPDYGRETLLLESRSLLTGRSCLHGGGIGWWKYEFCYGKSVVQYHEDRKVGRTEVLLGSFNEEIQKLWIEQNPQKQPLKIENKVVEIYQIYSGGDICDEQKFRRSVEVRIRCTEIQGSSAAVSLSLIEPTTCQYVLRIESSRFCEFLQQADNYGLLKVSESVTSSKDIFSSSKEHTEL